VFAQEWVVVAEQAEFPAKGLLVATYHHVRQKPDDEFPGIHGITREAFETQLDILGQRCRFATPEDVERLAGGAEPEGPPKLFLTFDDGLIDHYETVLPVLIRRKIHGAFFLSTLPWTDDCLLATHCLHYLSGKFGYQALRGEFERAAEDHGGRPAMAEVSPDLAARAYAWDNAETALIKYYLNYVLDDEIKEKVVRSVFARVLGDERPYVKRHYMTPSHVCVLRDAGMVIGMHTHTHVACETIETERLGADLTLNWKTLQDVTKQPPTWLSYPFGTPMTYGQKTDGWLERLHIQLAFTVDRRAMTDRFPRWRLSRLDTNDLPGGKSPLMRISP
jgi:peptidoglycan/xylan/chitin deacetylase (PgdA/CDA1 family)